MTGFAGVFGGQQQRSEDAAAWRGLKVGVASYSLRNLPTDAAIRAIQRVGLRYCSIKDVHLPRKTSAEERQAGVKRFADAGITPLSCGTITMSADPANIRGAPVASQMRAGL